MQGSEYARPKNNPPSISNGSTTKVNMPAAESKRKSGLKANTSVSPLLPPRNNYPANKSNINPVSAQPSFRPNPRQVNRRSNSSSYQNGGQPNLNNMSRMPNQLNQNYMPSNQYADNNSNNYSFRPSENF